MAIRAFDPRENSRQLTRAESVRLEDLEQRLDEIAASMDMRFARHKEELMNKMKKLMQQQMEAITRSLKNSESLYLSVEKASFRQGAKVIDEMSEPKVIDEMSEPMVIDEMPEMINIDVLHSNEDFAEFGGDNIPTETVAKVLGELATKELGATDCVDEANKSIGVAASKNIITTEGMNIASKNIITTEGMNIESSVYETKEEGNNALKDLLEYSTKEGSTQAAGTTPLPPPEPPPSRVVIMKFLILSILLRSLARLPDKVLQRRKVSRPQTAANKQSRTCVLEFRTSKSLIAYDWIIFLPQVEVWGQTSYKGGDLSGSS